jgi:hypothetical protein
MCALTAVYTQTQHATQFTLYMVMCPRVQRHFSDLDGVCTPQLFYTYFYNHAHRLRLEKRLCIELSRISNGFLKPLLDPDATAVSEVKRPKKLTAIYLTDIPQRTQVSVRV